ncbi:MAG: VCBS repeat-containing protein [Rhizonema sp. PD37]|nr:VCBS repeat-containing protein [Rhizonema sp. PD37]
MIRYCLYSNVMPLDPNQQLVSTTQVPTTLGTQSQGNLLTTDLQNGSSSSSQPQIQAAVNPNTLFTKPFPDFNGDGKSDIFWRNPSNQGGDPYSTSNNAVWLENGSNTTGAYLQTLDSNWSFSFADFNGDGKSDIFWNNSATGENKIWLMDGSTITNATDASQNIDSLSGWTPTLADFNGDNKTDILWRNSTTGDNQIWLMDGTTISSKNQIGSIPIAWTPTIVDLNGDRRADIFWRNSQTGENQTWIENDATQGNFDVKVQPTLDSNFTLNVGDFNGDGKSDILWRNSQTGENAYWIFDGANATGYTEPSLGTAWTPKIGDFNGDGKTDVFWRNTSTGDNAVWISDNTTGTNPTGYSLPTLSTDWTQDFGFGDFNGDGRTDIFWRNNSTGQNATWTSADTTGSNFTGALAPSLPTVWKNYSS